MKCPRCNTELELVDFLEDLRLYQCPNCYYEIGYLKGEENLK